MGPGKTDFIDETILEFLTEIKEDLENLEPDLLAMEEKGAGVDTELVNHAFRSIHSIKGGAGFIDHSALARLGHAMENVLMRVREEKLVITPTVVDALLAGFDRMKLLVEKVGTGVDIDVSDQEAELERVLTIHPDGQINTQNPSEETTQIGHIHTNERRSVTLQPLDDGKRFSQIEFEVDKFKFEKAREQKKFIYAIHMRCDNANGQELTAKSRQDELQSIGDILYSGVDPSDRDGQELNAAPKTCFFVISTILDIPLLSQVLEINKTHITLVGRKMTDGSIEPDPLSDYHSTLNTPARSQNDPVVPPDPILNHESISGVEGETSHAYSGQNSIRVNMDLVSRLMARAGELVLSRNQLRPLMESIGSDNRAAASMMQNLDMVTADMQETITQMRMQPVGDLLMKYKRVVRDIARRMDKKVEFIITGSQVEVDRNILEKLANPLTHLIRNCIDHGIETPGHRQRSGKPEKAVIQIKTEQESGHVHMVISDDGSGIDPQLVLSKAFEKGLVPEADIHTLTDRQKINLIFLPGFSTSDEITDISGRGVGMDVVKTNIEELRGQIEIESEKGTGTQVHLMIPLTLSIVSSLIVGCGKSRFAIPHVHIKEILYLEPGELHQQVKNIAGSEVLRFRDEWLPILRLRTLLQIETFYTPPGEKQPQTERRTAIADRRSTVSDSIEKEQRLAKGDRRKNQWDATHVMILKMGNHRFGLCVDDVHDIQEVVVEPLSDYIQHLKYYTGATILGDGQVIMILDIQGIAAISRLKFDLLAEESDQPRLPDKKIPIKNEPHESFIIFNHQANEYFALPLNRVKRVQTLTASDIHSSGNHMFYEIENQGVRLISLDSVLPLNPLVPLDEYHVIFLKEDQGAFGLLVSRIVDTMDAALSLSTDIESPEMVAGKIFMADQMIQVLNPDLFFGKLDEMIKNENR